MGSYGFAQERKGQLIAADALYFRSPENLAILIASMDEKAALSLITQYCGVCSVYGYGNLALEALQLVFREKLISSEIFSELCDAIAYSGKKGEDSFWPGQGRLHSWLKKWVNKLEPRQNSIWINDIGNE